MTRRATERLTYPKLRLALFCALLGLGVAHPAWGQPADSPADDEASGAEAPATAADQPPGTEPPAAAAPGAEIGATLADPEADLDRAGDEFEDEAADPAAGGATTPTDADAAESAIRLPNIFNAPTGRLLPAGHLFFAASVDTGGGVAGEARAGLGDVAEFGLELTDLIRARATANADPERIWPYVLATFKMGLDEDRLFRHQPALALGFRKSFAREADGFRTRVAELYLVASKSFGSKVAVHAGGVFWDASIELIGEEPILLHERGVSRQLRAFGGIEIEPLPDAKILLETFWVPEFCYDATCSPRIKLTPNFAWGVRYQVADWVMIESGVRIPDVRDMNLIDAQIFGQVSFVSRKLTRLMKHRKNP